MDKKIALFDFDNTLIDGDSVGHLLKYYFKTKPYKIFFLISIALRFVGYLCGAWSFSVVKKKMWQPFYDMSDIEVQNFIDKQVEPHYFGNIFNELRILKEQGYFVIIVSASIEDYLRALNLDVDAIIGTKVLLENNKIKDIVVNCIGENKVPLIDEFLSVNNISYDFDSSIGYSDSKMDYLMMEKVSTKYRVELKTGKKLDYLFTLEDYNKKKIFK